MNGSRLGEFHIDTLGRPHIIYGDYAYDSNGNSYSTNGNHLDVDANGYHNLWYAFSETLSGSNWQSLILDATPTLYNWQFWVDLTTDENGVPAVAKWIWKPGTITPQAYGTYTVFFRQVSGEWNNWTVTRTTASFDNLTYKGVSKVPGVGPDTVAGMGPGIVKDKYGWHGVWDNSHPRPFEHEEPRGGTIYHFSSDGVDWSYYQIIAPFSVEAHCEAQIRDGVLNVLVLGDHTDTQLYLLRYKLPGNSIMEFYPDRETYYEGETISLHALVRNGFQGDWYAAAITGGNSAIN